MFNVRFNRPDGVCWGVEWNASSEDTVKLMDQWAAIPPNAGETITIEVA